MSSKILQGTCSKVWCQKWCMTFCIGYWSVDVTFFWLKKNPQVLMILVNPIQPQQPSTFNFSVLELKKRLKKNKHLPKSSSRFLEPNPKLEKCKKRKEQYIAVESNEE